MSVSLHTCWVGPNIECAICSWQWKELAQPTSWVLLGFRLCNVVMCMKPNPSKHIVKLTFVDDLKTWHVNTILLSIVLFLGETRFNGLIIFALSLHFLN